MKTSYLLTSAALAALLNTTVLAKTSVDSNQKSSPAQQSTMIVLDGSNSMWGQLQGINKIVTARESLKTLLESADGNINFGLLTYGSRKRGCNDFKLVSKPENYDMVSLLKNIYRMNPKGRSPVADSLRKAASILPPENAHILLVSDGKDSCGGDPCAVARELRAENPSLQIDVIGFREDKNKEEQLECIAENGSGAFVVANNTERLKTLLAGIRAQAEMITQTNGSSDPTAPGSVEISLKKGNNPTTQRANYTIYTLDGNNVAGFTSRIKVKEYLKPGTYRVKASWKGRNETETVIIRAGQTSQLEFDGGTYGLLRLSAKDAKQLPVAVNYSVYLQDGEFISKHVLRHDVETPVLIGNYRIKADFDGKIIEKKLEVTEGYNSEHIFTFEDK